MDVCCSRSVDEDATIELVQAPWYQPTMSRFVCLALHRCIGFDCYCDKCMLRVEIKVTMCLHDCCFTYYNPRSACKFKLCYCLVLDEVLLLLLLHC